MENSKHPRTEKPNQVWLLPQFIMFENFVIHHLLLVNSKPFQHEGQLIHLSLRKDY